MNPILRLVDNPAAALADLGWALMLCAALVVTWWALGRNLLYLRQQYQNGWKYLVPLPYAGRVAAALVIVGVDAWLFAALVAVLG
jgi:hypothetical protein